MDIFSQKNTLLHPRRPLLTPWSRTDYSYDGWIQMMGFKKWSLPLQSLEEPGYFFLIRTQIVIGSKTKVIYT